jgi:hypothetical protein
MKDIKTGTPPNTHSANTTHVLMALLLADPGKISQRSIALCKSAPRRSCPV